MNLQTRLKAIKWISRFHLDIAYKRAAAWLHPTLQRTHNFSAPPAVTVLVTTFNCRYPLELTLRSLRMHTNYPNYRILVAHNASTDGTIAFLQELIEQGWPLELIDCDEAKPQWWWFDWMMEEVETPYWVGLHQDMYFLSGDWLTDLVYGMEQEEDLLLLSGERSPARENVNEPVKGGKVDVAEKPSTWIFCARRELGRHIDTSWRDDKRRDPTTGKLIIYEHGAKLIEDMQAAGLRYDWMPSWYGLRWQHIENLSWAFAHRMNEAVRRYKVHQLQDCERRAKAMRNDAPVPSEA